MIGICIPWLGTLAAAALLPPVMGVDGKMHQPLLEAHGKPAVFLFICHDCPICNSYAPEVSRIEAKYGGRVEIEIVYSDPRLTRSEAQHHAKEYGIAGGKLLLDPTAEFAAACGAKITPQAVVFDSQGDLAYTGRIDDRYFAIGQQRSAPTTHELTAAIDAVLLHRAPKPATGDPVGCFIVFPHKP